MAVFIFGLIVALVAVVALVATFVVEGITSKLTAVCVCVVAVIISAICIFESGNNSVPIRNVGIQESYGKVVGQPLPPGFHWEFPSTSVIDIPETTTTDNYNQDPATPHRTGTCITTRLGQGQEGCADVSITYNVNDSGAAKLLNSYGASNITEQVQNNLVYNNIRQALNNTLGDYQPIADALLTSSSGTSQFSQFDPAILGAIQSAIGDKVTVTAFDLQYVHYSTEVQGQLDGIQQKQGALQQEKQQLLINTATAQANAALVTKSGSLTADQLQQECMTIVQDAIKSNYQLPATFGNCISPANGNVIVGNNK